MGNNCCTENKEMDLYQVEGGNIDKKIMSVSEPNGVKERATYTPSTQGYLLNNKPIWSSNFEPAEYEKAGEQETLTLPDDLGHNLPAQTKVLLQKEGLLGFKLSSYPGQGNRVALNSANDGIYYGEVSDEQSNLREGKGYLLTKDNKLIVGYFKGGSPYGPGTVIFQDAIFKGFLVDGLVEGSGSLVIHKEFRYTGNFVKGLQSGEGVEVWPDNCHYKGSFLDGMKEGYGEYQWGTGSSYKGHFKKNMLEGFGHFVFEDGKSYEGEWKHDKMDGKGKFVWPDGKTYVGGYKNGQKDGFGEIRWPNGRRFEGTWKEGKQEGQAVYYDETGRVKKGTFTDSKKII